MRKAIVLGLALIVTGVALLSLSACKKTGKEKVDEMSEIEMRTDDQTTVYTDNFTEEITTIVCLARELNVRAEPDSGAKTIATVSRGDTFAVLDDKYPAPTLAPGYDHWLEIETADGTRGWVPGVFVIGIEAYKQLEGVDYAAKTGDSAKTEKAIKAFNKRVEADDLCENFYKRSSDGEKFAISSGPGGFIVTVGYGVSSRAPLGGLSRTGSWQYGSKYWSIRGGDCAMGGLTVYDAESMKSVLETNVWLSNYEFSTEAEIVVWPTPLDKRKIEYPLVNGPKSEPDYKALAKAAGIEYFTRDFAPCLMVCNLKTGDSYMAAGPDLTTITEAEGYVCDITLKPTERFITNPLFEPVSNAKIYREWVGKPVNGCLSEE
ncbi:MAG: SH3 domain-containing protein [bacterium]|nr:SH3 domain-containing protein [bacterium]